MDYVYSIGQYKHTVTSEPRDWYSEYTGNIYIGGECYKITGTVDSTDEKKVNIYFRNNEGKEQFIGSSNNEGEIDIIASPFMNISYDTVIAKGKELEYSINNLVKYKVNNKLSEIISRGGRAAAAFSIKKIGVQAKPGTRLILNGEEIRIGQTSIYEIGDEKININSFSLGEDADFIMDYVIKEEVQG